MQQVEIAGRTVGPGNPCFIIAEAGVNHNSDIDQAKRLVEVAAASGADAVKFQTFKAERLASTSAHADGVVSLCEPKHHPYLVKRLGDEGEIVDFIPMERSYKRRQDLPPAYGLSGAIYMVKRERRRTFFRGTPLEPPRAGITASTQGRILELAWLNRCL